jgi:hypothetical protein
MLKSVQVFFGGGGNLEKNDNFCRSCALVENYIILIFIFVAKYYKNTIQNALIPPPRSKNKFPPGNEISYPGTDEWFLKYFRRKFQEKNGVFDTKPS